MCDLPFAGGVEGYFVPPSDLAERLIKTAYLAEGRHLQREADDGLPEELGSDQLLLLLVHLKVRSLLSFQVPRCICCATPAWAGE